MKMIDARNENESVEESGQPKQAKRDRSVFEYLTSSFVVASSKAPDRVVAPYDGEIDALFKTSSWGFRELLLTVAVGMHLDPDYRSSTDLYKSHPRAIYEGPIKTFLVDNHLPHRKSGPLNIAKATKGLDETWAAQRRPREAAEDVVDIVGYLEDGAIGQLERSDRIDAVCVALLRRLIHSSRRLDNFKVSLPPETNPEFLYHASRRLVDEAPDAGNTPQKIAALLLENYHKSMGTGIHVSGGEDRASVTSTTSHKPGDVNEETEDARRILKVYEITVKSFDAARIGDSYDTVQIYNETNKASINEIIVICRPQDCPDDMHASGLQGYLGCVDHQGVTYRYWNIYEWMAWMLQKMPEEGRHAYYTTLNEYVDDINTDERVKSVWRSVNTKRGI